jgi:hypothetical protein
MKDNKIIFRKSLKKKKRCKTAKQQNSKTAKQQKAFSLSNYRG